MVEVIQLYTFVRLTELPTKRVSFTVCKFYLKVIIVIILVMAMEAE